MTNDIFARSLVETIDGLAKKTFSKKELNSEYLARIEKLNPKLNAYLQVNPNSDQIPAAIKDLISVKGLKMTCASKILEDYSPVFNATVIEKLYKNQISVIGKTNLDEFAMGSSGENSAYGPTINPWNSTKITGGSSSGSAAAVASDLCTFALGTDTGGSIRQPASLCSVVGLKPSYGRVSRYGAQALASSLDQIGPITKTVEDARLVLNLISGGDNYDSNAKKEGFSANSRLENLKGVKLGFDPQQFGQGIDKNVKLQIQKAISQLEKLGAKMVEVNIENSKYALASYYLILASEVSANLARYDGLRFGKNRDFFGDEAKRRIMLGTFALSSGYFDDYYIKAAKVRTLICADFNKAYKSCDAIVGPTSPTVAWDLGQKTNDPLTMYLSDIYTIPASLAGLPAISIPCGFAENLPVGLQIVGKFMQEEAILDIAQIFQDATNHHLKKPNV